MKNQKFHFGSILIGILVILILIFGMIAMLTNVTVSNLDAAKISIRRLSAGQNSRIFNRTISDYVKKLQEITFIVDFATLGSPAMPALPQNKVCNYISNPASCSSKNIHPVDINTELSNYMLRKYPDYSVTVNQQSYNINHFNNRQIDYTLKVTFKKNNDPQSIDS
ncbi:MAG: hypothetical protein ACR2HS_05140, partial [Gammaproteobacteria bacterium]